MVVDMPDTFFFYDLETTGFSSSYDRIMQFAGIRTNMQLEPIGEPVNILVKLSDDVLPSPGAILTTHITPQSTQMDGITEAEFCDYFLKEVMCYGTTILGYNSIHFDDEFIRHTLWRSFRDPYEWSYTQHCSRWDLLDVVRMVRALRPEGIVWPTKEVDGEIKPTVNLVDMAKSNGFENKQAHDALADVKALINLAKLIKAKQPKLWDYLYLHRNKASLSSVVKIGVPCVLTSGRLPADTQCTTVVLPLGNGKYSGSYICWDLRHDPSSYFRYNDDDIATSIVGEQAELDKRGLARLPLLTIKTNACPAVAPFGVLDEASEVRVKLTKQQAQENAKKLLEHKEFIEALLRLSLKAGAIPPATDVDGTMYESFIPDGDKVHCRIVAHMDENALADCHPPFHDPRLPALLLRYKARNYSRSLSESEQLSWEKYRAAKLKRELPDYLKALSEAQAAGADEFILQELQLWAESIMPFDMEE